MYNRYEKQGANLTVECILRSLLTYMKEGHLSKLRRVYIQMDNAKCNKNHVVIAAMCVLCLIGVCVKVSLSITCCSICIEWCLYYFRLKFHFLWLATRTTMVTERWEQLALSFVIRTCNHFLDSDTSVVKPSTNLL